MKKSTQLDGKLKVYASLAMGAASIGLVNGQIVYTDVNPDVVITNVGDSLSIDFDADGLSDYTIRRFDWGGVATNTSVIGRGDVLGNGAMGSMGAVVPYLSALNLNDPIGSAGNWQIQDGDPLDLASTQQNKQVLASTYSGGFYGNFGDNAEHYIGIIFQPGGGTNYNYGWIRVSDIPQTGNTVTIKDFAYNTVADQQILAGQMTAGIAEEGLNVSIFAADRKLNIRTEVSGSLSVINAVGQNVVSQQITENTVIDMSGYSAGIYTVRFESNGKTMVKKVSL
ncbi:hypothetical protein SDC9_53429 [bioreactor metagenome]|uniref:Secretion system C-terminal sorting domain-containing protein n=1 Tax=bioreactor metagenome TaxID=1076179 RepID=A0A644WYK3_9ZZZZ